MTSCDWRDSVVSEDCTHHLLRGRSMYAARFEEVLKFHPPGLAPASDSSGAFHINTEGLPVYSTRFLRTFGYYEGLAAVVTQDGWTHIQVDGVPIAVARWAWVGNFQGNMCAVRDANGRYLHVDLEGSPIYATRYAYAGDFRDGIAVVQREDGYSTHIDSSGKEIHGRWFVDLDVFHKGYARARTENGWMHVDRQGQPAYSRRFASVEPFYNGQARVEREDGGLEIIDETGKRLLELRPSRRSPFHMVSAELVSFWRCEAVLLAVEAGLFERLPLPNSSTQPAERRLLGALGEIGLVARTEAIWELTSAGALLRADQPGSLVSAARYWRDEGRRCWTKLPLALADPAWCARDPFVDASCDSGRREVLHAALNTYAEHDYAHAGAVISPGLLMIDAGGGLGALSIALLRAWPNAQAVVLERPEVVSLGKIPDDLAGRLTFVGCDLFAPWPACGETVVLARVLHDWPDERAAELLLRAREAVKHGGTLYVVDFVQSESGFAGGLLSLHMLLATGGQERSATELQRLMSQTGWQYCEVRPLGEVVAAIVARAV